MESDAFKCGWNDVANGVNDWHGSDRWKTPLEWINHIRQIALDCRPNTDYHKGAVAACDAYKTAGGLGRKER